MNNTYITYAELLWMLHPYFLANWWEDYMSPTEISHIINLSIQDMFNNSDLSFTAEYESIQAESDLYNWKYLMFKTKKPINLIHELLINDEWDDMSINLVNTMPHTNVMEFHYKKWTNTIFATNVEDWSFETLSVNYNRDYIRNKMLTDEDRKREVPVPFAYIPALIKLIYDTASPLFFFQWDGNAYNFFEHGKSRLKELERRDIFSSNQQVNIQ
jgi:hypothetical protein